MNELKFNSQVCTTKEQSQRLLNLGLEPETADMYYTEKPRLLFIRDNGIPLEEEDFPAWSLYRLMEMLEIYLDYSPFTGFNDIGNASLYDDLIDLVENMISKDIFNKEYLK